MPDRIVEIAKRDGHFSVSLRWRDDWLRARCRKLVKKGLLRKERGIHKGYEIFVPRTLNKETSHAQNPSHA